MSSRIVMEVHRTASSAPRRRDYAARLARRLVAAGLFAAAASPGGAAGTASEPPGGRPTIPFVPLANEPAPAIAVEPPLPEPLRRGAAIIPYRTQNFRILPIFGAAAAAVSPRAGHLHVTVDDLPWRWADTGDNGAVVVVGLPPGEHKVRIELATPEHRVLAGRSVTFSIPETARPAP